VQFYGIYCLDENFLRDMGARRQDHTVNFFGMRAKKPWLLALALAHFLQN